MATCFLLWLCTTCLVLWQLLAHQTWNTRKCRFHITWFQISKLSPSLPNWLSCLYSRWEHKIEQATVRIRCFTGYCERLAIIKSFPMYTPCNLVFKIVYLSPNLIIFKLWWQIWVIYLKICLWHMSLFWHERDSVSVSLRLWLLDTTVCWTGYESSMCSFA